MDSTQRPTPPTPTLPRGSAPPSPGRPLSRSGPARSDRRTWPWRDYPSALWLVLAAAVTLAHPFLAESRWLMVHLVVLGALTHAILVWSTHFAQALLKTEPGLDDRGMQARRFALLFAGTTLVVVGVPTAAWPVTVVGASCVGAAVCWHGIQLFRRLRRALPGRFRVTIHYYLAAVAWLPVGATFGALLARGLGDEWHGRLLVAHTSTMFLGWVGLTVAGTLVTFWPTMLRTRMDDRAEPLARQALPVFLVAVAVTAGGALLGSEAAAAAGLVAYLAALAWWGRALVRPARTRPPREYATGAVLAALVWLIVGLAWVGVLLATRGDWVAVADAYGPPVAVLVAGFAAQLLTGALSYLVPSVVGGGSAIVRARVMRINRWAGARLVLINAGLLVCLLPVPSAVRVTTSVLVLLGFVAFLPLLVSAVRASDGVPAGTPGRAWPSRQLAAAAGALGLAVALGVGIDPTAAGLGGGGDASVTPTGRTTTARVEAVGMRFVPDRIEVPAGDRLVVELHNTDPTTTHDLVLASGASTGRVDPGGTASLDAGVVGASLQGWCSVVGHRQMGMTFAVDVTGGAGTATAAAPAAPSAPTEPAPDLSGTPAADFTPVDAALPPLPPRPGDATRTHRLTLQVSEEELEVAPGVWQRRWTFGGRVPGPTLHGRVGDVFDVTLVNDGSMGHSIDFHAGALAPDRPMRTIAPGESLRYRFTATRAGIWMYHCSTPPMSAHIAAGMHGAVVIEPPDLPKVDRSYLLVQSEVYLGPNHAAGSAAEVDADKAAAERPDAVVFNGVAGQYDHARLPARVGERIRVWVLAAGPNRGTSFHVVGGQFDTVYAEGAYRLQRGGPPGAPGGPGGSQTLALGAAQGGFVELVLPEPGNYPFVNHVMVDAERGARGFIRVTR